MIPGVFIDRYTWEASPPSLVSAGWAWQTTFLGGLGSKPYPPNHPLWATYVVLVGLGKGNKSLLHNSMVSVWLDTQPGTIVDTYKTCSAHLWYTGPGQMVDIQHLHNNQGGPHCCKASGAKGQICISGNQFSRRGRTWGCPHSVSRQCRLALRPAPSTATQY